MIYSAEFLQSVIMTKFDDSPKNRDKMYWSLKPFIDNHLYKALKNKNISIPNTDFTLSWSDEDYIDIYMPINNRYGVETNGILTIEVENFGLPKFISWAEGDDEQYIEFDSEDFR